MNFKILSQTYRRIFSDKHYIISLLLSFALLAISLILNEIASLYSTEVHSNAVSDLILSNIPVFDVDWAFVYGPLVFWVVLGIYCLQHPQKIPFMLKSIALFVIIRSVFISLTHIGPYPDRVIIDAMQLGWLSLFANDSHSAFWSSGGDLFFSAHTGLPFLMALIFWQHKKIRIFSLCSSVFFGIIVLLGHLHYSIDVMAAFFITYTIYHISTKFFESDLKIFAES